MYSVKKIVLFRGDRPECHFPCHRRVPYTQSMINFLYAVNNNIFILFCYMVLFHPIEYPPGKHRIVLLLPTTTEGKDISQGDMTGSTVRPDSVSVKRTGEKDDTSEYCRPCRFCGRFQGRVIRHGRPERKALSYPDQSGHHSRTSCHLCGWAEKPMDF